MSAWKRLTTLSTASSERAMTRMVLSPAMVPRSSGHLSESMASAAACALAEMVLMTMRLTALSMDITDSASMRIKRSLMPFSARSAVAYL